MISLRSARLEASGEPSRDGFPFSVPIIASRRDLEFAAPVTFLVGENGCGKSTLLEALALAAERVAVGSADLAQTQPT